MREVLAALTWGPPTGRLERADRILDVSSATTPVEWLLARACSWPWTRAPSCCHARSGWRCAAAAYTPHRARRHPNRSSPRWPSRAPTTRSRGAAGDVVRRVEELLETWATDPPKALRAGGLGVRDRARTAAALDIDQEQLSLLLETAQAAGMLAIGGGNDEVWLPTATYDTWRTWSVADRWSTLVEAWLATPRVAGAGGQQGQPRQGARAARS